MEKDQEPNSEPELEAKDPEPGQEVEQVRPRRRRWGVGGVGVGSLTSVWPGLEVAGCGYRGCGLDCQLHLPGSLSYSLEAEFDSRVFLLSTCLIRLPLIPWMTEILASSSCQVRGSGL